MHREFRLMTLSLVKLRGYALDEVDISHFSPYFIDFLADVEMWKWIESGKTNWLAAGYIVNDLAEIMVTNSILQEKTAWDQ